MAHDKLCPAGDCMRCHGNFAYCMSHVCDCTPIRAAREDERARIRAGVEAVPDLPQFLTGLMRRSRVLAVIDAASQDGGDHVR